MANSRSPYCTGLPFSTYALTTSPSYSDVISFISFIASMMQRTWSFFTRSPISTNEGAPGSAAFVEIGSAVKKGDVLCIIEAMKLMNEIDSEYDGEIVNIYVENGQPVQYGERLFAMRTK